MATVRAQLKAALAPKLPAKWVIVPAQRNLDVISAVTIMFKQSRLAPHQAAPAALRVTGMTITLIDPHTDIEKAEDALDENLLLLLTALESLDFEAKFTEAQKVSFNDTTLAYDITVEIDTVKP